MKRTARVWWRCFHCGEAFRRNESADAREHFGPAQTASPICQVSPAHVREMEAELERYREEDTDLHREIHALHATHHTEMQREEERGYQRGLRDAASEAQCGLRIAPWVDWHGCVIHEGDTIQHPGPTWSKGKPYGGEKGVVVYFAHEETIRRCLARGLQRGQNISHRAPLSPDRQQRHGCCREECRVMLTPTLAQFITGLPVIQTGTALKLVERRVRGGYMNRWLIREVVVVPAIIATAHAVYVHPERWDAFVELTR